jgi:hypothetical protein
MRTHILVLAVLCVLASACAGSLTKPQTVAVAPPPPAAQKSGAAYDPRMAESNRRAREMGYHMETRHGEQFYCRTTAPIGSRIEQKECLTAASMAQAVQMADENQAAKRQGQVCQGAHCVVGALD